MFASKLLKSGLVAAAILNLSQAVAPSPSNQDRSAFPEFAAAMDAAGSGFGWESVPVTTASGYQLNMFHLLSDTPDTKGPLLLTSGIYSESLDWVSASDPLVANRPAQLVQSGYDVWIGESRGARYSIGHTTLDRSVPADDLAYWEYSFTDIGREDYPLFVDTIVESRAAESCSKVTLVAHSGAANEATYMAIDDPTMAEKVGKIVTLAPCINLRTSNFAIDEGDLPAYYAVYNVLSQFGVNSFFDPDFEAKIEPICLSLTGFCDRYFSRAKNPDLKQGSINQYQHVNLNSILGRFQDLIPASVTDGDTGQPTFIISNYELPEYNLEGITIPTSVIYADSELDGYCPESFNASFMNRITGITSDWVTGLDHTGFLKDNSVALTDIIKGTLPELAVPLTREGLCPKRESFDEEEKCGQSSSSCSTDKEKKASSNSSSDKPPKPPKQAEEASPKMTKSQKKELKFNRELEKYLDDMDDIMTSRSEGDSYSKKSSKKSKEIVKRIDKVIARMNKYGFETPELASLEGYSEIVRLADSYCSGSSSSCDEGGDGGDGGDSR